MVARSWADADPPLNHVLPYIMVSSPRTTIDHPETQGHVHPGGMLTIAACHALGLTGIVATDQCQIDPPRVRFADSAHRWSYLHLYSCVCTFHVAVFGPRSRGPLIRKLFTSGAMNNVHPGSAQRRSMVRQPPAIIGNN